MYIVACTCLGIESINNIPAGIHRTEQVARLEGHSHRTESVPYLIRLTCLGEKCDPIHGEKLLKSSRLDYSGLH